jgi:peptide/nickel transport system permease protein
VISVLIFVATAILPGDVATAVLGRNATPEAAAQVRERLDLERPAVQQYTDWLTGVLHGDLGESATGALSGTGGASVWELSSTPLLNSFVLALITLLIVVPLGLALGVAAARSNGGFVDRSISLTAIAAIAIPEFVIAAVLIAALAGGLRVLPAVSLIPIGGTPLSDPSILVLPVITLMAASLAQIMRMVRAGMLDTLSAPYVEAARLSGLSPRRIELQYALRNAVAPTIQVVALTAQWLIGGIIITETIFGYPGIGQELAQAVAVRDVPFVQSVALLIAAVYVFINILADILVVVAVPRLRSSPENW